VATTVTVKKGDLRKYLRQWQKGDRSKSSIELELGVTTAKGKYITRLWEQELGVDTRRTAQV
jgi:hypothetical protein